MAFMGGTFLQVLLRTVPVADTARIVDAVIDAHLARGTDINTVDGNGGTLLHRASSKGCVEPMLRLISAGADTNIVNKVSL